MQKEEIFCTKEDRRTRKADDDSERQVWTMKKEKDRTKTEPKRLRTRKKNPPPTKETLMNVAINMAPSPSSFLYD
jgi:hypothetical protein